MLKNASRHFSRAALFSALALSTASAFAGSSQADFRPRLDKIETSWKAQDADAVASVYSKDAIVTGQDSPDAAKGRAAVSAKVKELMAGARSTKISIYDTQVLSDRSALTWVTWDVEPKDSQEKPFSTKSLFVWKKVGNEWLIVADMYALGPMSAK
ncbi:hypothetical protein AWB79_04371 [Caballeronia hypogeia]|uniref:DUF4440 domain-containing protein n=1 Tax=Caballeronia hypogeia TaxID=1777140 RepID=A0A158BY25_9BURK|nr:nuclear transport factor 2 family protein [Caballeronia hypogeia]SAK74546.1 hypothetical protein AWB79_04371 [Caballeronia hypogeia]